MLFRFRREDRGFLAQKSRSSPKYFSMQRVARDERYAEAPPGLTIRALQDCDVEAYVKLRREALLDSPLAFVASPADDAFSGKERVRDEIRRAPESVIIGAFRPHLVGAVGLHRDRLLKSAHKVHLWGLYVTPNHRRQGIASELLDAVLCHASDLTGVSWVHLKVSAATPGAQRLYERAGFRVWGAEPAGACYEGQTVVDYHMALCLEPDVN
jgi:ribosomal protein S18 acetylase RimI-like enzyme